MDIIAQQQAVAVALKRGRAAFAGRPTGLTGTAFQPRTLHVGRARTIVAGGSPSHNAFPSISVTATGRILVGFRRGTTHTSIDGAAMLAYSDDNGDTFTVITVLTPAANQDYRNFFTTPLADGSILGVTTRSDNTNANVVYTVKSTDNGATWSAPSAVPSHWDFQNFCEGRPVQNADGSIVLPVYGRNTADAILKDSCGTFRSTNGGTTWGGFVLIGDAQADNVNYTEAAVFKLPNGNLGTLIRRDSADHHKAVSTNGGVSWGAHTQAFTPSDGKPAVAVTTDGSIVCSYRSTTSNNGAPAVMRFSRDNMATWSTEQTQMIAFGDHQYSAMWEISPGVIATVIAMETGASTVSDLMLLPVTERGSVSRQGDSDLSRRSLVAALPPSLVYASETLDRADENPAKWLDSNQQWTAFANGGHQVSGGRLLAAPGSTDNVITLSTFKAVQADGTLTSWLLWGADARMGLVFRFVDSSNYLMAVFDTTANILTLYDSVGTTALAAAATGGANPSAALALASGFDTKLTVTMRGNRIKAYIDAEKVADVTLTGAQQTKYGTAKRHGIRTFRTATQSFGPLIFTA